MSRAGSLTTPGVAIGLSIVGLLIPPLGLLAIGLGLIALKRARSLRDKRIAQGILGLSSTGVIAFGVLLWFGTRPTPSAPAIECRVGLQALTIAQEAHRKTRGRYAASQEELGIAVADRFFLEPSGSYSEKLHALGVGRTGQCPGCTVTMACLETPDGQWWTITSGPNALPQRVP